MSDDLKALSVRQPWAWAIVFGGKDVENRSWPTRYRGRLLVHAGSAFESAGLDRISALGVEPPARGEFARGAIIGAVEVVACIRDSDSPWAVPGLWHWLLTDPHPLLPPIPCPGRLSLWTPPSEALKRFRSPKDAAT